MFNLVNKVSSLMLVFLVLAINNYAMACTDGNVICQPTTETINNSVVSRTYDLDFNTVNQSLIGNNQTSYESSVLTIVDRADTDIDLDIDVGGISTFCLDPYIESIFGETLANIFKDHFSNPCYSYGARMETDLFTDFGVDMKFTFNTGTISIAYPIEMLSNYPEADSFRAYEWVTIDDQFQVKSSQTSIDIADPSGSIEYTIKGAFNTHGWGKGCVDDCSSSDLWGFNQSGEFGGTVVAGQGGERINFSSNVWPIGIDNALGFMAGSDGYVAIPEMPNLDHSMNGKTLISTGSDKFIDLSIDIPTWYFRLLKAPFFVSAAVSGGSVNLEGASLGYKVLTADVDIRAYMHRRFKYTPTFYKTFHFSTPVNWLVIKNGVIDHSGFTDTVELEEGESLSVKISQSTPVSVDTFISQQNTFLVDSWVNNKSDFDVQALDFLYGTPSWTIFNERCFVGFCLPRLGWDGTNFNPGPVVDVMNTAQVDYDYDVYTQLPVSINGFQTFQLASFDLNPNLPPQISQLLGSYYPSIGDTVDIDLSTGFTDPDGNPLSFSVSNLPAGFSVNANNHIVGTITADVFEEITITAADPLGDSVSQNIIIDARFAVVDSGDGMVISETGTTDFFQVHLNRQPTSNVEAVLSANSDIDLGSGFGQPHMLVFDSSNWNTPQVINAIALDDFNAELDQNRTISVSLIQTTGDMTFDNKHGDNVEVVIVNDDVAGYHVTPLDGLVTSEDGNQNSFDVVLTSQPFNDVTVQLASSETLEGTIDTASLLFTPANWNIPQTVVITGQEDSPPQADGANNYLIVNSSTSSLDSFYQGLLMPSVQVVNMDNDTASVIFSQTSGIETNEAGGTNAFTIQLSTAPISPPPLNANNNTKASIITTPKVFVTLTNLDDTEINITPPVGPAKSGSSPQGFQAPITYTFTPTDYNVPQVVNIAGLDDAFDDGDITVTINTDISVDNEFSYANLTDADLPEIEVINENDDFAQVVLSKNSVTIDETGTTDTIQVSLDVMPVADVNLLVGIGDSTEVSSNINTITFTPANWNIPQDLIFSGVDDIIADETIYSTITLQASSADSAYNSLAADIIQVATTDNDVPSISVTPSSGLVTTESGGQTSFLVVLDVQPTTDVTIPLTSLQTTEAVINQNMLTFTPANWSQAQSVTVTGVDDFIDDGNSNWTIQLLPTISTSGIWSGLDANDATGSNIDDDDFAVTLIGADALNVNEDGLSSSFSISLSSQPTANVTFPITSSQPSLANVTPANVVFTPNDWNIPHSVSVQAVDNQIVEPTLTFNVLINPSVSSDSLYANIDLADPSVLRGDNDQAGVSVFPTTPFFINESGTTHSFFIKLQSEPTETVTIPLSTTDATEASINLTSVSFTALNWDTPQEIIITGVDDNVVDSTQPFQIITADTSSTDSNYSGLAVDDISGNTDDDETPAILVTPNTTLIVGEDGTNSVINVRLSDEPTSEVKISLSSGLPTEVTVDLNTLTFDGSNWNIDQQVVVQGVDDDFDDDDQTVDLTIGTSSENTNVGYAQSEALSLSVINIDDDAAGVDVSTQDDLETSEAGGKIKLNIKLKAQPVSDVEINLNSSDTSEGTLLPNNLVFTMENWQVPQEISVIGVDDTLQDGDVNYQIIIEPVVTNDPRYQNVDPDDILVVNRDNDLDSDNDSVSNEVEGTGDRDADGLNDSEDYDPTGYFYNSETGAIVTGSKILITCDVGTAAIVNNRDGRDGYYQYTVTGIGSPSVCSHEIIPPAGFQLAPACSHSGMLDIPSGPFPLVLGSDEVLSTGFLGSASCLDNPWYNQMSFEDDHAIVFANNIPLMVIPLSAPLMIPIINKYWLIFLMLLINLIAWKWNKIMINNRRDLCKKS